MADTAALVVALSAQLTKFEKDMKGAVDIANKRTKEIEGTFTKMNANINNQLQNLAGAGLGPFSQIAGTISRLGPLGATAAAGFGLLAAGFAKVVTSVKAFIDEANKLRDAADTTGLTIFQLKELNKAGLEVGVSAEQVESSVGKMTVSIDQLKEATGPLYERLKKVPGVLLEVTTARDAGEAIDALAKHFASLSSEFEKNAFLRAVFGRGGLPFGRVLQQIADAGGLKALEEQAGSAANEFNNLIKRVDDLSDQITKITDETKDMWGTSLSIQTLEFLRNTTLEWKAISGFVLSSARDAKTFFAARPPTTSLNQPPGFPQLTVPPRGTTGVTGQFPGPFESGFTQVSPMAPTTGGVGVNAPLPTPRPQETLDQRIDALKRWIAVMGDAVPMEKRFQLQELELQKQLETTTVSVQDQEKARTSKNLQTEIDNLQKYVTAMGNAVDPAERLFLEELKIRKATVDGTISKQDATRALAGLTAQEMIAAVTLRERLGVASEEEIVQAKLTQARLDAQRVGQTGIDLTKAEIIARKEAKETIDAQAAALSKLPDSVRYAQQAMDKFKQLDQVLVSTAGNFENAFADIAVGSKTAAEAFKSLADSIIRDLIRMTLRLTVTGPLLSAIGAGATPTTASGGGLFGGLFGRQGGGPVRSGQPYVVGEHGPELFVPQSAGHVMPNAISHGKSASGTSVEINNYVAADTETKQTRQQGPTGDRIIIDIVKKAQARGELDDVNRGRFGLRPAKVR